MRLLGIDYGTKKIGLALGDTETQIASPIDVLRVDGSELVKIVNLITEEGVEELVIGVPLSAGAFHNSQQLKITRAFIEQVKVKTQLPVHEVDERYTSVESQRLQMEEGALADEDALAAMLILQAYFSEPT